MRKTIAIAMSVTITGLGSIRATAQEKAQEKPEAAKPSWTDGIALKGDFRYRYEYIDEEGKDSRQRDRIRLRVGLNAKVNDEIKAGVRLASGSDDPVSSNQSLGEGFSSKDLNLDQAFVNWAPAELTGTELVFGKMAQPWIVVKDYIWDGDLNPEGVAANYTLEGDTVTLLAHAGYFWIEERKADDDAMLYSGQLALKVKVGAANLLLGGSVFAYDSLEGFATVFDPEESFGNSVTETLDAQGEVESIAYATEFTEVEGFAQIDTQAAAIPVKAYGSYVQNTDADVNDKGYIVGLTLGKAKKPGSMEFDYNFRELEADAVLGVFADSDSWGGGTDGNGHRVSGTLQIAKNWQLGATYFINDKGLDRAKEYNRLQLDLMAKF